MHALSQVRSDADADMQTEGILLSKYIDFGSLESGDVIPDTRQILPLCHSHSKEFIVYRCMLFGIIHE